MIPSNLPPLANHLWQSTIFAAAAGLVTLALRKNRPAVRYGLWFAASVKFLVPFSLLVAIGSQFEWRPAPAVVPPQFSSLLEGIGGPFVFTDTASRAATALLGRSLISDTLFAVWLCGFLAVAFSWLRRRRHIRAAIRTATRLDVPFPIRVMSSRTRLEPGVFGIFKPVLLLPEGIADRLTPAQLQTVLAHELCHVRRHDNLTAAIHMVVEAAFWFLPPVWWIETRLVAERERACDEEVLRSLGQPEVYAQSILNVCKLYLESPLVCVSGITGANLKRRIEEIMAPRIAHKMDWGRKILLGAVAAAGVAGPVAIGLVNAPSGRAQPQTSAPLAFEIASVKPNKSGETLRAPSMILPGGSFTATNNTVRSLILNAYGIFGSAYRLSGGPGWIDSERFDIEAKAAANAIPAGTSNKVLWEKTRLMLRTLLADRFKLSIRRETREMPVYELAIANNGPKLQKSEIDCGASHTACHGFSGNPTRLSGTGVDMYDLSLILSSYSDRPVLDKTGVTGLFDIKLQWNPFAGRPQEPTDDVPRSPGAEAREGPRPDLASLPTLFTALEQQLRLKLESRKGPVEIYVIDHVERPSGN
jgi:uncharacterized protein (TIGR03435 family)